MRFLLTSDTRGRLGVIDELADRLRTDGVIHPDDRSLFHDGKNIEGPSP